MCVREREIEREREKYVFGVFEKMRERKIVKERERTKKTQRALATFQKQTWSENVSILLFGQELFRKYA